MREAGLSRVTVSLDSPDDGVFRGMNDMGVPLARVLERIAAAHKAGFGPWASSRPGANPGGQAHG